MFPDKRVVGIEIRDKVHEYLHERIKALREERPGQARAQHRLTITADLRPASPQRPSERGWHAPRRAANAVRERGGSEVERAEAHRSFLPQVAAGEALLPLPGPALQGAPAHGTGAARPRAWHRRAARLAPGELSPAPECRAEPALRDCHRLAAQASNHRRRIIQRSLLAEYAYVLKEGGVLYTLTDVAELGSWMADRLAGCPLFRRLTPEEEAADPCVPLLMASEEAQKARRPASKCCHYAPHFRRG